MHDVIIVGGGPAGLSAALVLGRCRRSVLIIDQGNPRNAAAKKMHGYLTRDGIGPKELLRLGRREIHRYRVEFRRGEVVDAMRGREHFQVRLHDGSRFRSRKLLLATGVRDQLPRLPGLTELYGKSVHHCPYCDGWEWRDRALAAFGEGKRAIGLALSLKTWSDDVVVCTNGQRGVRARFANAIEKHNLRVFEQSIARLDGRAGKLRRIVFADGSSVKRDALFFSTGQRQKSMLAERLGCEFDRKGGVVVDKRERTNVPGLFLCGDASKDVQFVIKAAAEGAVAAVTVNKEFQEEEGRVL
ncbi:MAG: NAD(P)/FAD-dependent oxidoreductase [Phycisphaerales bacterium]|nr:NAD(P)/FAD-dependent oxidoreductase [Phycisphaerales bacterium]MCI0629464.1 NAD(P)/FAD-dependent oxidoreductase [Phycisphaerales bacterium]MCI0676931.1 NAD(P)/FAD-dependent oxidoreductase [Phycisphaerales bacterium]